MIVERDLDAARAHAAVHAPALAEAPVTLDVQPGAGHLVVLVAAQRALDAVQVHVAAPPLVHAVELGTRGIRELSACEIRLSAPAQADSGKHSFQVDDATRGRDRRAGKRQILPHVALADVGRELQRIAVFEPLVPCGAELRVADALAGVERRRGRVRLARVGLGLRARQSERVLGVGLVQRVHDEVQS